MPLHNQPVAQQVPELSHFPGRCCPVCPHPASPSQARSFPGSPCPKQPGEQCRCIRSVQRGPGGVRGWKRGSTAALQGASGGCWGGGEMRAARTLARPPARWGSPLPSRQAHPATGTYRAAAGCGSAPRAPTCSWRLLRPVWDGMGWDGVGSGRTWTGANGLSSGRPPPQPPAAVRPCCALRGGAGRCAGRCLRAQPRGIAAAPSGGRGREGACPRSPGRVLAQGPCVGCLAPVESRVSMHGTRSSRGGGVSLRSRDP